MKWPTGSGIVSFFDGSVVSYAYIRVIGILLYATYGTVRMRYEGLHPLPHSAAQHSLVRIPADPLDAVEDGPKERVDEPSLQVKGLAIGQNDEVRVLVILTSIPRPRIEFPGVFYRGQRQRCGISVGVGTHVVEERWAGTPRYCTCRTAVAKLVATRSSIERA